MNSVFEINKENLFNNLQALPCKNICAMVKADAYGHNLETIAKLLFGRVNFFGVANINEALRIRVFDKATPILIVGLISDFESAIKNNISFVVDDEKQIEKIINLKLNMPAKIHLVINTGMNRIGINKLKKFNKIIKIIKKNSKKIIFEGILTHFSTCECDKKYFNIQKNKFKKYLNKIPKEFSPIISLGGSGVLKNINPNSFHKFMFRIGIDLYTTPNNVLSVKSKIVKIFEVKKNQRVGYSNGYIAKENKKIGLVPLGYYDGINRMLGNNAYVKVNNQYCKIIGNVCMDMFFIDLTSLNAKLDDEVEVFFNSFYWADICQTLPYEILTSLKYQRMELVVK